MKKVPYLIVVTGACVASVVTAARSEDKQIVRPAEPTPAQESATDDPADDPKPEPPSRGAHSCAVFPITFYGGATLYQADYFENDNCNPPYLAYLYGTYSYPQTCGVNCVPSYCPHCVSQPFYGLNAPVPSDYDHVMPREKPRKYSKECHTPDDIEYLRLRDVGNRPFVYVKVFSYKINEADLTNEVDPPNDANFLKKTHFAFECQNPAVIGVDTTQIKVIRPAQRREVRDPHGADTTVYDVTYSYDNGTAEAHILTLLCGDPVLPWTRPEKLKMSEAPPAE